MKRILVALIMALTLLASALGAPSAQMAASGRVAPGPQAIAFKGVTTFAVPASAKPDALAYYRNNFQPVAVASDSQLTWSSIGNATERGPVHTVSNCAQAPKGFDFAHATNKQLQMYGVAPRGAMPLTKWLKLASAPATNVCHYVATNGSVDPIGGARPGLSAWGYKNILWGGNVADQNCASNPNNGNGIACQDGTHNYNETDSDYYIPTTEYTFQITSEADMAQWVGVGGINHTSILNQDGTEVDYIQGHENWTWRTYAFFQFSYSNGTFSPQYQPTGNIGQTLGVNVGDHMFAEVYQDDGQGGYWLKDLTQNWNFNYIPFFGTGAAETSAEQIVETGNGGGAFVGGDTTFYGAGVTDTKHNPTYIAYSTAQHDYESVYEGGTTYPTDVVLNPGPIQNDPGDPPYDQYTVYVFNPCGGHSSC